MASAMTARRRAEGAHLDTLAIAGSAFVDVAPCRRGPHKGHRLDVGVVADAVDSVIGAMHDVEHAPAHGSQYIQTCTGERLSCRTRLKLRLQSSAHACTSDGRTWAILLPWSALPAAWKLPGPSRRASAHKCCRLPQPVGTSRGGPWPGN